MGIHDELNGILSINVQNILVEYDELSKVFFFIDEVKFLASE